MEIAETELRRQLATLLPELRGFARFLARDRTAADDLVQEAVVRGLAALHQFQRGTSLKAWMFTILRNAFYEHKRRSRRESEAIAGMDGAEGMVDVHAARSDVADLQRLIWTLPPLLREALILVGAQELSHEEAATVCGVPVGTMKARLSRARTELARRSEGGSV